MITQILEICIIPLLGILTKYLVSYLNARKEEAKVKASSEMTKKYMDLIYSTISDCVIATNQTYVDSLKKSGSFDKSAQEEAFNKTMSAVLAILTEDAKQYIVELTGDMDTYLTQLIEAEVKRRK